MWNDWLSSLNGPTNENLHHEIPEPIETPKRFSNPQQIERLQNLQAQHQQLQVQQLHLLQRQYSLVKQIGDAGDSNCTDGASTAPQSPSSGVSTTLAEAFRTAGGATVPNSLSVSVVKVKREDSSSSDIPATLENARITFPSEIKTENDEDHEDTDPSDLQPEVWQQFHALQAQQWAQALNQARIAKRQNSNLSSNGLSTPMGVGMGLMPSSMSNGTGLSGGKRCKAYAAPKGVWKNNGGYNATIYVHKRRIYGPIRRDLSDAIEDRKEMEDALRELTAIHNSPEDAAILEVEMREVVAGLRNRSTPNRIETPSSLAPTSRILSAPIPPAETPGRKRLRLVGTTNVDEQVLIEQSVPHSPDVMGPFAAPVKTDDVDNNILLLENHHYHSFNPLIDDMGSVESFSAARGYTPNTGPIRDLYASPAMGYGLMEHHDPHDIMLPDSMDGGLWGTH